MMMHGPDTSADSDRTFWVFVVLVVLIFLFLGIGVTFAQTVTATEHITVGSRTAGAEAEKAVPVDV
jgi:Tfp pilus assembly protein PilX